MFSFFPYSTMRPMPSAVAPFDRAIALACTMGTLRGRWLHARCACAHLSSLPIRLLLANGRAAAGQPLADLLVRLRCDGCGARPVSVHLTEAAYPPAVHGDVLVVASPGQLGVSREDIRQAIGRVAERRASVQAADGIAFGSIELQALIAFETSAHLEVERERLAPARKALRRGEARKRTLTKVHKAKLLPLWRNTDEYTVEAVLQEALAMGSRSAGGPYAGS